MKESYLPSNEDHSKEVMEFRPDMIMDLFVTSRCDMDCPFCYGADVPVEVKRDALPLYKPTEETIKVTGNNELRPELSLEQCKLILDKLAGLGLKKLNLGGGEPLLRHDTPDIIKYAKQLEITVYLSTNATFTKAKYDLIKDNIDVIGLPLDGSTVDMNVAMGRAHYLRDRMTGILQYLNTVEPKHKVKVGTVISKVNINDIVNIGRLLFESEGIYHPDVWRVYQFEKVERGEDNAQKYEISDQEFWNIVDQLRKEFPQANIAPRANSDHNNAYFFISPDGMLQLVDNRHRSVLDISTASPEEIYETVARFDNTIVKNVNNRTWMKEN